MGKYFFGIAGWSYADWAGIVYPEKKPRGFDPLSYLTEFFDTIELNNTFYRIPESKVVSTWAKRVSGNPRFRFTAKLWEGFTHNKIEVDPAEVKQFKKAMEPLLSENRMGSLLLQFPISFQNEESARERLSLLAKHFRDYPLVVEFRHRSWVNPETLEWLRENKIGYCNVDEPMFRKLLKPSSVVTGPVAYVRFHGRNYQNWFKKERPSSARYDYLYSEDELDEWIPSIQEMGKKAKDVYVIGNNHFRGQAPTNVLQLKSKTIRGPVEVPESLIESYPQLEKIAKKQKKARAGKQPSLFSDED
jgi:uncharacterized protein YecE (DUF72 family)